MPDDPIWFLYVQGVDSGDNWYPAADFPNALTKQQIRLVLMRKLGDPGERKEYRAQTRDGASTLTAEQLVGAARIDQ